MRSGITILVLAACAGVYIRVESTACVEHDVIYNNSHPSHANRSDLEPPPSTAILKSLCNTSAGGVLHIDCPGMPTSSASLTFICHLAFGAKCDVNTNSTDMCPDLAARFSCKCPSPATTRSILYSTTAVGNGAATTVGLAVISTTLLSALSSVTTRSHVHTTKGVGNGTARPMGSAFIDTRLFAALLLWTVVY